MIFSDEKKFNLDGPDGFSYYFHDIRKEELLKNRRVMGSGGIMVSVTTKTQKLNSLAAK